MEPFKKCLAHNTIKILNFVARYLKIKTKEKSVDIIDLKLGSSLK